MTVYFTHNHHEIAFVVDLLIVPGSDWLNEQLQNKALQKKQLRLNSYNAYLTSPLIFFVVFR